MKIQSLALMLSLAVTCAGQNAPMPQTQESAWHDPSPHSIQFVTVAKDIRLEVLDWGGSGQPMVLLAGLGDTAHVFDDLAPKLTLNNHVYGITRRGYGASSVPQDGYSSDQLGDDVLAVLDALKISRPILVGHSFGGAELSSVGTRYPDRVRGLIYLDAGYGYAYYDRSQGDYGLDRLELHRMLEEMASLLEKMETLLTKNNREKWNELADDLMQRSLPRFQKALDRHVKSGELDAQIYSSSPGPGPTAADLTNITAFTKWLSHIPGALLPEAEIRERTEIAADGHIVGQKQAPANVLRGISDGMQKYTDIRLPVLAIYAMPGELAEPKSQDKAAIARLERSKDIYSAAKAFESGVPHSHVVCIPNASHYLFISNETDVLREMRGFLATLP